MLNELTEDGLRLREHRKFMDGYRAHRVFVEEGKLREVFWYDNRLGSTRSYFERMTFWERIWFKICRCRLPFWWRVTNRTLDSESLEERCGAAQNPVSLGVPPSVRLSIELQSHKLE